MSPTSIYDTAGGAPAMLALAADFHRRCLADDMLEHPFSHAISADHVPHLAQYWGAVLGGPPAYAPGHSHMLEIHAHQGMQPSLGDRFVEVFDAAVVATLPPDEELRRALHAYMRWAMDEVMRYDPPDAVVPADAPTPHWDYSGLVRA